MNQYLTIEGLTQLWETTKNRLAKRDNDFNYVDDFIPFAGQLCFVDTATAGLKLKVGDGITKWKNLSYYEASATSFGLSKLYQQFGTNEDGSCTQKFISSEFQARYKTFIDQDHEELIFKL